MNKKRGFSVAVAGLAVLCSAFIFAACASSPPAPEIIRNDSYSSPVQVGTDEFKQLIIGRQLLSMSLEEKIAQLFIVDFYSFNKGTNTEFNNELEKKLEMYPVAGFIYFSDDVVSSEQLVQLNKNLQNSSDLPLFIATDEEGGSVSRLGVNVGVDVSRMPTAADIGDTCDLDLAYSYGLNLGVEMVALGFNMNFSPVADVYTNPYNRVIGNRAYSDDPQEVADFALATAHGLIDGGIIPAFKHFPGHGDTLEDSHRGFAYVHGDIERLSAVELVPFVAAAEHNIPCIMVGHISVQALDSTGTPASLSQPIVTGVLREQLGYDGLVITDSLQMDAVTNSYSSGEAAVLAIKAGNDILLMPKNFESAYDALLQAVSDGEISEQRIDQSVLRILSLKYNL